MLRDRKKGSVKARNVGDLGDDAGHSHDDGCGMEVKWELTDLHALLLAGHSFLAADHGSSGSRGEDCLDLKGAFVLLSQVHMCIFFDRQRCCVRPDVMIHFEKWYMCWESTPHLSVLYLHFVCLFVKLTVCLSASSSALSLSLSHSPSLCTSDLHVSRTCTVSHGSPSSDGVLHGFTQCA